MNSSDINGSDILETQMKYWLKHINKSATSYKEPKLDEATVEVVRLFCDVLNQADEVFIACVDVLEEYIFIKDSQEVEIPNSMLCIACAILMTSKLIGSHPEIKIASIQTIITKLTSENIDRNAVKQTELDIFLTLGKLPLTTMATDLSMLLEYYIKHLKLIVNIQPLCLEILNVVYIFKRKIFYQLKSVYIQSVDALEVFEHLVCNKMYFPGGIVLCTLRITKFKNFLNLKQVAQDIGNIASIHQDHLQLLAGTIFEFIDMVK